MATASRSLNNIPSVDARLASRVRQAADELDYRPNAHAKALAQGSSRLVGLLVHEGLNYLLPTFLSTFESIAASEDYCVLVAFGDGSSSRLHRCVIRMLTQNVEGIVVMMPPEQNLIATLPSFSRAALVSLDQGPSGSRAAVLKVNYQSGMRECVQHLAALGHRNIALLNGPAERHASRQLFAAFQSSLEQMGLAPTPDLILEADMSRESAARALRVRMQRANPPTAVIAASGLMAAGALTAAREQGLRTPEDLSVVAFGGMRGDPPEFPALTSMDLSPEEMARTAFAALKACLREDDRGEQAHEVRTRLVVRQSTSLVRAAMHIEGALEVSGPSARKG